MGLADYTAHLMERISDSFGADKVSSGLLLLVVQPLFRSGATVLRLELSDGTAPAETPTTDEEPWEIPYSEFQAEQPDFRAPLQVIPALRVPEAVCSGLAYRLMLKDAPPDKPLWLKLAAPYGLLGTVPWEAALGAALKRPVLRVPDFPGRPVERADVLESALIVDAGADADPADIARRASSVARATLDGSSRVTTRIHVFAGFRWQPALRALGNDPRVVVHDPGSAPTYADAVKDRLQRGQSPLRAQAWADWVLSGVGSRTLDAVHMMTRVQWTETGAYFPITVSPSPYEEQSVLTSIDLNEFGLMTTRIGAWVVTFTPPSSDIRRDVAFIADRFAHLRPCAVLFDAGETQEDAADLRAACRLLFSGRASAAPQFRSGFLSCHPGFVRGEAKRSFGDLLPELAVQAGILAARAPLSQRLLRDVTRLLPGVATKELTGPPAWIAVLQRLLEETALGAARRSGSDVLLANLRPGSSDPARKLPAPTERAAVPVTVLQDVLKKLGGA